MKSAQGKNYLYLQSLLSSAACIAALSLSTNHAQARSMFNESTAVPAIEINLDAINQLKVAREDAAAAALQQAEEAKLEAANKLDNENNAQIDESDDYLPETLDETEADATDKAAASTEMKSEDRLPIIIKKVEAPVAPMYKSDTVVSEVVVGYGNDGDDTKDKGEQRTVASMFRDLFYGDNPTDETQQSELKQEAEAVSEADLSSEDDKPLVEMPNKIVIEDVLRPIRDGNSNNFDTDKQLDDEPDVANLSEGEDEPTLNLWVEDEPETQLNHVTSENEDSSTPQVNDSPSFFDRIIGSLSDDTKKKKEAIAIERPAANANNNSDAPSIFNDSDSDFKIVNGGKELLEDALEEQLVTEDESYTQESEAEKSAEPDSVVQRVIPEGAQVILPNVVDKYDDVIVFKPKPTPKPEVKQLAAIDATPKLEAATAIKDTNEAIDSNNQNTNNDTDNSNIVLKEEPKQASTPRSLDDKKIPSPQQAAISNIEMEETIPNQPFETVDLMDVEEKELPQLDQPSIPIPTDVVDDKVSDEVLMASPVKLKAQEPEKGLLAKAKNWFGIKDKSDKVDENSIKVPPAALQDTAENTLDDVPAFLPEPVDISATVEKLESLNINRSELQEGFTESNNSKEAIEKIDEIITANDVVNPSVILPNEVKENVKAVAKSLDNDKPIDLAALNSKAPKTAGEILDNEGFDGLLSLNFLPSQNDIPFDDVVKIKDVVNTIKNDERKRLKIKSYASPIDDRSGSARRISLQRAIAIRSIMVENGIEGVRINVQAMGNTASSGAKDRADILVIED